MKRIKYIIISILIISGIGFGGWFIKQEKFLAKVDSTDIYTQFVLEVFDKIKENYWMKIPDGELEEIYRLAGEKITEESQAMEEKNRNAVKKMAEKIIQAKETPKEKEEFAVVISDMVLRNLQPIGKSRIYTRKDATALANQVNNINPEKNLYENLDLKEGASKEQVEEKYEEKIALLEKENTEEAKEEIKKVEYAHKVLSDSNKKERYDKAKIEPTIYSKIINSNILHIHLQKFSPITFNEFQMEVDKLNDDQELNTLIIDLRDNIGGAIDILPQFLGFFIGNGQYAYEFFHQDNYEPYKTQLNKLPSLSKFKKVVVLANSHTQSTAELMTSVLKKYNYGVFVGEKTNGWGSIEKVFELDTRISETEIYSIFLVHTLTLSDVNQPIESNGVEPNVKISDSNWGKQLSSYFDSSDLASVIEKIWGTSTIDYY